MTDLRATQGEADGGRSGVTAKIVAVFEEAIASGELGPEAKLPPTRQLADLAGVNHLTAARAYRRLAEQGLVASRVGAGTFVRPAASIPGQSFRGAEAWRPAHGQAGAPNAAWQRYALPDEVETYGDRILAEMFAQAGRQDVVPLMVGYPGSEMFPVELLAELSAQALREEGARAHQYCAIEGLPELRETIAGIGGAQATGDDARNIVVTTGCRQALTLTCRAVLRPGDLVAIESPSYTGLIEAIRDAGATPLGVPTDGDGLDTDALESLLRRREIRMLAIQPRLHNPTGADLSPERRARLVELARTHGFFVLEDGVYADLRFEGEHPRSLRAEAPEHVIYVSSLSKTVSPGLRAGWVAASGPVLERIIREKRNDDMHGPMLPQMTAERLIRTGGYDAQVQRAVDFHRDRCRVLTDAVRAELGDLVEFDQPHGGGHLWLRLDPAIDERDLYAEALRQGVSFLPGSAMFPERSRTAALRISFCFLEPERMREGVRRLGVAMRELRPAVAPEAMPIT